MWFQSKKVRNIDARLKKVELQIQTITKIILQEKQKYGTHKNVKQES